MGAAGSVTEEWSFCSLAVLRPTVAKVPLPPPLRDPPAMHSRLPSSSLSFILQHTSMFLLVCNVLRSLPPPLLFLEVVNSCTVLFLGLGKVG